MLPPLIQPKRYSQYHPRNNLLQVETSEDERAVSAVGAEEESPGGSQRGEGEEEQAGAWIRLESPDQAEGQERGGDLVDLTGMAVRIPQVDRPGQVGRFAEGGPGGEVAESDADGKHGEERREASSAFHSSSFWR